MKLYTFYISFIFLVKIIYFIFALLIIYFDYKKNNKLIEKFTFWKHHIEFLFINFLSKCDNYRYQNVELKLQKYLHLLKQ